MKNLAKNPLPSVGFLVTVGAGLTYLMKGKKKKGSPIGEVIGEKAKTYFDAAPRSITGSHSRGSTSRSGFLFGRK